MNIGYLVNHPDLLDELAPYLFKEWGHHNNEKSVNDRVAFMTPRLTHGGIPTCFVAFSSDGALGTVSLIENDFITHPQYTPWLASLYVVPKARRSGVGELLIERAIQEAKDLNVEVLYLTTAGSEAYYKKFGWKVIETAENHGRSASIMSRKLVV